uniref:Uncharacterized protein n=1 Tax=Panagrolaimus sp. JU765 TaxID=591449 RepID=A0AC34QC77_9BILA
MPTPQPPLFTPFPPFAATPPPRNIGTEGSVGGIPNPFAAIGVPNIDAGSATGVNPNPFGAVGVPNGFGNSNIGATGANGVNPNPFGAIGVPNAVGGENPEPAVATPAPTDQFPTLIPENGQVTPSISSFIEERSFPSEVDEKPFVGSNGAVDGEIRAKTGQEFSRVGKKKGVLTPPSMPGVSPDELVELIDNGGQAETVPGFVPGPPPPDPPTPSPSIVQTNGFWTPPPVAVQKADSLPEISGRTTIPIREASGDGLGYWRFAVRPSGYTVPPVEVSPSVTTREIKAKADRTVAVVAETDEAGSANGVKPPNGQQSGIFTEIVAETDEAGSANGVKPPNGQQTGIFTEKVGDIIGAANLEKRQVLDNEIKKMRSKMGLSKTREYLQR